jgi:hypothetical protein
MRVSHQAKLVQIGALDEQDAFAGFHLQKLVGERDAGGAGAHDANIGRIVVIGRKVLCVCQHLAVSSRGAKLWCQANEDDSSAQNNYNLKLV